MLPPRDSTAYIIDEYILPPVADTVATSRRLIYYHIGWTDIPAARTLISCEKVLDYVSPRELEEWEYRSLELEEAAKAKAKEEEARNPTAKKAKTKDPKRPGRPSKVRPVDEEVPEEVAPLSPGADEALAFAKQAAGPSLSTPKKRKLSQMLEGTGMTAKKTEDEEMYDEEDLGEASNLEFDMDPIQRQLHSEAELKRLQRLNGGGLESESDSVDQLRYGWDTSAPESSRASSSKPGPRSSGAAGHANQAAASGSIATPASVAHTSGILHPALARSLSMGNGSAGKQPEAQSMNKLAHANGKMQTTLPGLRPGPAASTRFIPASQSPNVTPGVEGMQRPQPVPRDPPMPKMFTFTPIASSSTTFSAASSAQQQQEQQPPGDNSQPAKRQKDKKPKKDRKRDKQSEAVKEGSIVMNDLQYQQADQEDEDMPDNAWDVKELIDDRWEVDPTSAAKKKVHKYLVLWEGDWPPDQNPTWEPAENIQDRDLIKRYKKKKKAGLLRTTAVHPSALGGDGGSSSAKKKKTKQTSLMSWMSKTPYSNVAEAFEGDGGPEGPDEDDDDDEGGNEESEDELGRDELLAVTESSRLAIPGSAAASFKSTPMFLGV